MRWIWLRRTDPSRRWLHLTDDREPIVEAMFQNSTYIELGDGNTALFWSDRWLHGTSLEDMAPCLCNAVSARVRAQCTVAQALTNKQWIKDISGALTVQVLIEYLHVWDQMELIHLNRDPDRLCWRWTADRRFTTASAYRSFFTGQHAVKGAKLLCKARAPPKCKFFIWLVPHDRCWTAHRRKRRNQSRRFLCPLQSGIRNHRSSSFKKSHRSSDDHLCLLKRDMVQGFPQAWLVEPRSFPGLHFLC